MISHRKGAMLLVNIRPLGRQNAREVQSQNMTLQADEVATG